MQDLIERSNHFVLELKEAATGRVLGSRLLKLEFADEMKDAEGFGFVSREVYLDAKRTLAAKHEEVGQDRCPSCLSFHKATVLAYFMGEGERRCRHPWHSSDAASVEARS